MSSILLPHIWVSAGGHVERFLRNVFDLSEDQRARLLDADRVLAPDRYNQVEDLVLTRAEKGRLAGRDHLDLMSDARGGHAYRRLMESTQSRSAPATLFALVAASAGAITSPDFLYLTRAPRREDLPGLPRFFPGYTAAGESAISSVLPIEGEVVDVDAHLRAAGVNPEEWRPSEAPVAALLSVLGVPTEERSWGPHPTSGPFRRLVKGLRSLAERRDGNTAWACGPRREVRAQRSGPCGMRPRAEFEFRWWSHEGAYSWRGWWVSATLVLSTDDFLETRLEPRDITIAVARRGTSIYKGISLGRLIQQPLTDLRARAGWREQRGIRTRECWLSFAPDLCAWLAERPVRLTSELRNQT